MIGEGVRPLNQDLPLLQEPSAHQIGRIQTEALTESQEPNFMYDLGILRAGEVLPSDDMSVDLENVVYHERVYSGGAVREFTAEPDSPSMGLVVLPELDLKTVRGKDGSVRSVRLDVNDKGDPEFMQMGPEAIKQALASRGAEFAEMHSDEMHERVRRLIRGAGKIVKRTNTRSKVLEEALEVTVRTHDHSHKLTYPAKHVISTRELAYAREFEGERNLSRREASRGTMLVGPDGVVSSVFALGGMPPVSGSVDAITTAAMSYMRSWIPRNGVFAGDFQRQLDLFKEAKGRIESYGLPRDITENAIALIGVAVGSDNPYRIAAQLEEFQDAGGHAARIYTTSPDQRVVETARRIRGMLGNDFLISVGPIVSADQARALKEKANVGQFLVGHGGGENCTSLSGGGAANSLAILYELYLDKMFNDSMIGLEGGTGDSIGALLPMVDVLSVNKRGIGGIESTSGLYVVRNGLPVLPYHGSASAVTKLIEYYMRLGDASAISRIVGMDGRVLNVEGKPNYLQMKDSNRSNTSRYREMRELAGRVIADQGSLSLYELRERVRSRGHNHLVSSGYASMVADEHRAPIR